MTNIPRRKIYERMLIFEDGMIEMQVLLYNKDNYEKYEAAFYEEGLGKIRSSYHEIKALLVMFLDNTKFENELEFNLALAKLKSAQKETNKTIFKNKNLPQNFKILIRRLDFELNKFRTFPNRVVAKLMYKEFDKFNNHIPKLLEIRRDQMK